MEHSTLVAEPPVSVVDTVLTRRNFLGLAAGSAAALALYAGEISRHEIETIHRSITLSGLPDAFAGMRIVQISDFHFEVYDEKFFLEAIVRRVNALTPDMVLLTGDFVSKGPLPRRLAITRGYQCAEVLSRLTCPLRYAILGNHDVIVDSAAVTDALVTHRSPCWRTVMCRWSAVASAYGLPELRMPWNSGPTWTPRFPNAEATSPSS